MGAIIDELGEDVPDMNITEAIHDMGDELWWNEDKTQIGLRKFYNIEDKIAKELIRLETQNQRLHMAIGKIQSSMSSIRMVGSLQKNSEWV